MAHSLTVSTVWLTCARERRGYLWGGLCVGGSTLGIGTGGGLVKRQEALWEAPLEVLGGQSSSAAGVAV